MDLETYNQKRDFTKTPEPRGQKSRSQGHSYVIQKHEASHLHYDFRLEIDGVLKSWAIPKGPSLNPKDKRLAVQTEDHPLAYGNFEGVIPEPGYGAGTVMLWDTGEWQPSGDEQQGLNKGKLDFELKGRRLHGHWSLIKMRGKKASGKEWLLVKHDDEYADDKTLLTERYQQSVTSQKAMDSIAKEGDRLTPETKAEAEAGSGNTTSPLPSREDTDTTKDIIKEIRGLAGARLEPLPDAPKPQLATLYKAVPTGSEWLHEIKYDGYRLIVRKQKTAQLFTRNQKDWTKKLLGFADAMASIPEAILDGELVFLNNNGSSNFQGLQRALGTGNTERLIYYVFDVLYYAGYNLSQVPLWQRKRIAKAAVEPIQHPQIQYSDHIAGEGKEVLRHACQHQLEGIISKEANSVYESTRSDQWRKIRCGQRQEFVIIGFTEPKGSRVGFGALLLGYYDGKALKFAGKVGTGFDKKTLTTLSEQLNRITRDRSPVVDEVDETKVTWVKPELVCEVEFTEWTSANRLRHSTFLGLRQDKPPQEIVRETPADTQLLNQQPNEQAPVPALGLSSPDKLLYPQQGITKQDLAQYYLAVAENILPYVAERPLSLVRCPQGHTRHCFFQKHPGDGFGKAVKLIDIEEKSGIRQYAYIDSIEGLVELVQMGTLEIHTWGSKVDRLDRPDTVVFDLDPDSSVHWHNLKSAAVELRDILIQLGLKSFLRTTGGKGLHLVLPIERRHSWDEVKAFAKAVAEAMVARKPNTYIATASKAKRKNKIFIDYLRNTQGATSICSYSTRSKRGAPLAMPLQWEELDGLGSSQAYRLNHIEHRLRQTKDPWTDYWQIRQSINQGMLKKLEGLHE